MSHSVYFNPAITGLTRIFITEGGSSPSHDPVYLDKAVMGSVSQSTGDVEPILVPSSSFYNDYEQIGRAKSPRDMPEFSITGKLPANMRGKLSRWARHDCLLTVHVPFGLCTHPRNINEYSKISIFENCLITNIDIDDLGSLDSNESINVTIDLTCDIHDWYEISKLFYNSRALPGGTAWRVIDDVYAHNALQCRGCPFDNLLLAVGDAVAATSFTVYYSVDMGQNWETVTVASGAAVSSSPINVGVVNGYVTVLLDIDSSTTSIAHSPIEDHISGGSPSYTLTASGFNSAQPRNMNVAGNSSGPAYVLLDDDSLYKIVDPPSGVRLVSNLAFSASVGRVYAFDEDFLLVPSGLRTVLYSYDGGKSFSQTDNISIAGSAIGYATATSRDIWWAAATVDGLYYTENAGKTWTKRDYSGFSTDVLLGTFKGIIHATNDVLFLIDQNAATTGGGVHRTIHHGSFGSWRQQPEIVSNMPLTIVNPNGIANLNGDPNFVIIGGEQSGSVGFIITTN